MSQFRHTLLVGASTVCLFAASATTPSSPALAWAETRHPTQAATHQSADSASHRTYARSRPFLHPVTYTVRRSDTLWEIAQTSKVSVSALKQENGVKANTIYVGERLLVPRKWRASIMTAALAEAPVRLIPVYKKAGRRYDVRWTVLAAIHKTETDFGLAHCPMSSAGAMGPMQFLPSTFTEYAVKAPGHSGPPNIQNVDDAIYTAAHMLSQDGYSRDPADAIFAYNHSHAYVQHVETMAGLR